MFNFNSTLLKTSVFTSQEKPTSVHQLLNHNYSQKAQAASPLKRFLNMCVCPRDSVCVPPFWEGYWQAWSSTPPPPHTPSCNRRYLPPVSPWSRLLKQDLEQRATLTSYFVFFHKIQHSILSLFTSLSSQKTFKLSDTAPYRVCLKFNLQGLHSPAKYWNVTVRVREVEYSLALQMQLPRTEFRTEQNPLSEKKRANCCFIMRHNLATRTELL